jgi:citrate synthase
VFLGVVEDTVRFLDQAGDDVDGAVARAVEAGERVPGLGHPIHKVEDPRTPRIYAIAEETGLTGSYLGRLREMSAAYARHAARELPINGAGVAGAALADLGFPAPLLRGFALLARTAGLLGHLAEELQSPIGMRLYREVDERAKYAPPTGE